MTLPIQPVLDALLADQQSGSTTLALKTLQHLQAVLTEAPPQSLTDIEDACQQLQTARPSMIVLSNALQQWLKIWPESVNPADIKAGYLSSLNKIMEQLKSTTRLVAEHAADLFKPDMTVMTHSRSSQVSALFQYLVQQKMPFNVILTLSAPGNEGLLVADQLNQWQVPTTVITDAEMGLFMPEVDINISGCDSWLTDHHFVNKSGTLLQALVAQHFGKPFWVLADSFKNSYQTSKQVTLESMPIDEMQVPEGEFIQAKNIYFETISTQLISGRIDETGIQRVSY